MSGTYWTHDRFDRLRAARLRALADAHQADLEHDYARAASLRMSAAAYAQEAREIRTDLDLRELD